MQLAFSQVNNSSVMDCNNREEGEIPEREFERMDYMHYQQT
jgi:hypothetical protein